MNALPWELTRMILRWVDDPIQCEWVCRYWWSLVIRMIRPDNYPATLARRGHFALLKWAKSQNAPLNAQVSAAAAAVDRLDILKWLMENGAPMSRKIKAKAILNNNEEIFHWAVDQGFRRNFAAARYAALHGNVGALALFNGDKSILSSPLLLTFAIAGGHFELAQQLRAYVGSLDTYSSICYMAAQRGDIAIMEWILQEGGSIGANVGKYAAVGGHIHVFKWLRDKSHIWHNDVYNYAAYYGRADLLKWLFTDKPIKLKYICGWAAWGGQEELLRWLITSGQPVDKFVCVGAAQGGHFTLLRQLFDEGFPVSERVCVGAARGGRLDILQWLHSRGVPLSEQVMQEAMANRDVDMIEWLCGVSVLPTCIACKTILTGKTDGRTFTTIEEILYYWDTRYRSRPKMDLLPFLKWIHFKGVSLELSANYIHSKERVQKWLDEHAKK